MISAERNRFPANHLRELIESFTKIDADDVRRVARTHLHPQDASLVAAGPITRAEVESLVCPCFPRHAGNRPSAERNASSGTSLGR